MGWRRRYGQACSLQAEVDNLNFKPWFRGTRLTCRDEHYGVKLFVAEGHITVAVDDLKEIKVALRTIQIEEILIDCKRGQDI